MISLTADYARLFIGCDMPFNDVAQAVRSVLQICRMNKLPAALLVSEQHALDWRSSHRVALRFAASRWTVDGMKLALVVADASERVRRDVYTVAADAGFDCRIFDREMNAVEWLTGRAPAKPPAASS